MPNQSAEHGSSRQDLLFAKANINMCMFKSADKVCSVCTLFSFDPMCAAPSNGQSICQFVSQICAQKLFLQKPFQAFHKILTSDCYLAWGQSYILYD